MSVWTLLGRALAGLPALLDAVDAIGKRISRRPPPPPSASQPPVAMPPGSPIYFDAHSWSRESPNEPPVYCFFCKQLRLRASQYCPGMPQRELS